MQNLKLKKLSHFEISKCDICKERSGIEFITVNPDQFIGVRFCRDNKCKTLAHSFLNSQIITKEILENTYGKNINIKRQSGKIENDWLIYDNAYLDSTTNLYWVRVCDKDYTKIKQITIQELEKFNSPLDQSNDNLNHIV